MFSGQFRNLINQTACLVAWLPVLIAQRFGPQTQWRPQQKVFNRKRSNAFFGLGPPYIN